MIDLTLDQKIAVLQSAVTLAAPMMEHYYREMGETAEHVTHALHKDVVHQQALKRVEELYRDLTGFLEKQSGGPGPI